MFLQSSCKVKTGCTVVVEKTQSSDDILFSIFQILRNMLNERHIWMLREETRLSTDDAGKNKHPSVYLTLALHISYGISLQTAPCSYHNISSCLYHMSGLLGYFWLFTTQCIPTVELQNIFFQSPESFSNAQKNKVWVLFLLLFWFRLRVQMMRSLKHT